MKKYKIKFIGISYNVIEDKGIVVCKVTAQIPFPSNDQWCLYLDSNYIEAKAIALSFVGGGIDGARYFI